jgi:prolyl-tRNA editing enzyme YbaK/EbsC (Cys-tRNA(Pro) deacylase)
MAAEALAFFPVIDRPDLVAPTVLSAVKNWRGQTPVTDIKVAEIDPAFCGGEDLCEHYGVDPSAGANCLIVEAKRGADKTYCACLAPVGQKMDLGGTLRRHVGARLVSMAPLDFVLETTGMEHGSVTPVGLPEDWKIFLDASLVSVPRLIVGGGLRKSKLQLPSAALLELLNASALAGLSKAG